MFKQTSLRSPLSFALLALSLYFLFWLCCSLPLVVTQFYLYAPKIAAKFNFLYPFVSGIGDGKLKIIRIMAYGCVGLTFAYFLLTFQWNKSTLKKFVLLVMVLPFYFVSFLWFKETLHSSVFNDLIVRNYPTVNFASIFTRDQLPLDKIKSWDDFFKYAHSLYKKNELFLKTQWSITDQNELKSIFYMRFVSRLWAYGDQKGLAVTGCVLNNQLTGITKEKDATVQTYLKSPIGCCTDYAKMLKFFYDREGITNRLVHVRSHVFNEVAFGKKWHAIDANTNLLFHDSWENIIYRKPQATFEVSIFPHHNLIKTERNAFRKVVGLLRYEMIEAAVKRKLIPRYSDQDSGH